MRAIPENIARYDVSLGDFKKYLCRPLTRGTNNNKQQRSTENNFPNKIIFSSDIFLLPVAQNFSDPNV